MAQITRLKKEKKKKCELNYILLSIVYAKDFENPLFFPVLVGTWLTMVLTFPAILRIKELHIVQ